MSKSTKSKSPAAPRVKKTAALKKAVVKKAAAAKKTAAPSAKKATAKKAVKVPAKKPTSKKIVTKPVPAKKVATPKKAAAKKAPVAKKKAVAKKTVISARIDIDFGNTLYVRGEGPGLSWDVGLPMNSVSADEWSLTVSGAKSQIIFKFLVNDISWNTGEDYVVDPGSNVVLVPTF